ncbi:hypothetical protein [Streptomyces syringium]|uniref:GNAT family N-acetyltransferase n=1 Tax=Streptomyces syringium TaxID=76729 RepID=A0ABS4Y5G1_9ACTN|nr:hypothetical protein [Streptomyces syringium]MBP2404003.1 hypothetical protein [Streptomyces syringium]
MSHSSAHRPFWASELSAALPRTGTPLVAIHYEACRRGDALVGAAVLEDKHGLTPPVPAHGLDLTPTTPVDHHVTAFHLL